eukprot:CAMPEP_0170515260 /NCGR_PEP_ID=MMETSP0209-20121228/1707_1 /TAXON_ID=665100 ORGANISM="Litonotus pictus, Strain P1" /NCGR_SAMPLE_ID=MMETSP0209 /ASSEMBLY_ACC=CAM_ASM_000301 /LENGTH=368 /DNA_ID=CAMNT_0010799653 /DNA_START=1180 /DNA_END=2286 /DNA_ORIENTATION=-
MLEFQDLDNFNQDQFIGNFNTTPVYLKQFYDPNKVEAKYSFTEHLLGRNPSFMEETIVFGVSGRYILNNVMQSMIGAFICYLTMMICYEGDIYREIYGRGMIAVFLFIVLIYFMAYVYLLALTFTWFTVYSSIDMNRDDKTIKKCIKEQLLENGETSEKLFLSFKKLYFDMMINITNRNIELGVNSKDYPTFNSLNRPVLAKLIETQLQRFKFSQTDEFKPDNRDHYIININEELKLFLSSCGNSLSNDEIEFMLHLVENLGDSNNNVLTLRQFYDIWGAVIHFSSKHPHEIILFVFEKYYEEKNDNNFNVTRLLNEQKVVDFFRWYKEYFEEDLIQYAAKEGSYLGKEFTLNTFVNSISYARRYHPN